MKELFNDVTGEFNEDCVSGEVDRTTLSAFFIGSKYENTQIVKSILDTLKDVERISCKDLLNQIYASAAIIELPDDELRSFIGFVFNYVALA